MRTAVPRQHLGLPWRIPKGREIARRNFSESRHEDIDPRLDFAALDPPERFNAVQERKSRLEFFQAAFSASKAWRNAHASDSAAYRTSQKVAQGPMKVQCGFTSSSGVGDPLHAVVLDPYRRDPEANFRRLDLRLNSRRPPAPRRLPHQGVAKHECIQPGLRLDFPEAKPRPMQVKCRFPT